MKALVEIGYEKYVMPFDDAVVLIRTLENMERVESTYISGQGTVLYIKLDGTPPISLTCMTDEQYAVMKMRGPKPQKEY